MIYSNNVITRRVTVTRVIISESTQLISGTWESRIIKRFDNASIERKDNYNDRHVALVFALLPAVCRLYTRYHSCFEWVDSFACRSVCHHVTIFRNAIAISNVIVSRMNF